MAGRFTTDDKFRALPRLYQQVGTTQRPVHLLFLNQPFADYLTDCRPCARRADRRLILMPVAVIRNELAVFGIYASNSVTPSATFFPSGQTGPNRTQLHQQVSKLLENGETPLAGVESVPSRKALRGMALFGTKPVSLGGLQAILSADETVLHYVLDDASSFCLESTSRRGGRQGLSPGSAFVLTQAAMNEKFSRFDR